MDVSQTCYVQWRNNRSLMGCSVTYELFEADFVNRLFTREIWEEKVIEFINLRQRRKSFHQYFLEFVIFFKYDPSLVSDHRDQMSCFVTLESEEFKGEFQSAMLHENMNISRLMVYA